MVSDLDIKGIIAPPIYLTTSSNSQSWSKPIFGLSLEVNLTTDVECFFSKSQVICNLARALAWVNSMLNWHVNLPFVLKAKLIYHLNPFICNIYNKSDRVVSRRQARAEGESCIS